MKAATRHHVTNESGIKVQRLYGPTVVSPDYQRGIAGPAHFPFTWGNCEAATATASGPFANTAVSGRWVLDVDRRRASVLEALAAAQTSPVIPACTQRSTSA